MSKTGLKKTVGTAAKAARASKASEASESPEGKRFTAPVEGSVARRRGRRPANGNQQIDRAQILACAFALARTTPLQELSIMRVARELDVVPGLIHYYLDGRDALTSGVMNAFYREMLEGWPTLSGEWRTDMEVVLRRVYATHVKYAGVAAYVVAHNRYRMEQLVSEGETDYGILLFESVTAAMCEGGGDSYRVALWSHLLMEFVVSMSFAAVRHRFPGEHGEHLKGVFARLDPKEFPYTHFVRKDVVRLNADEAFAEGLSMMLNAIELERSKPQRSKRANKGD